MSETTARTPTCSKADAAVTQAVQELWAATPGLWSLAYRTDRGRVIAALHRLYSAGADDMATVALEAVEAALP